MIILVEDDENKSRQILSYLSSSGISSSIELRRSYTSGLKAIRELAPDLVLLDMSLPNFDGEISASEGGKFRSYGGRDLLFQIRRRCISTQVVVVTQYEAFSSEANATSLEVLTDQLRIDFPEHFLGTVFYSASHEEWKHELGRFLARTSRQ